MKKRLLKRIALIKKASFLHGKHFQTTYSCSLKLKHIEEDLKTVETKVVEKKSKKKKIFSSILLLVNFAIIIGVFIYFAKTTGIKSIGELFELDLNWHFLWIGLGMFLLSIIFETLKFTQLIYKSTGRIRPFLSLKTHMLGKYYDNITPFAVGGQPFQIFYLNKHDIKGDKATSIPLAKQVIHTFAMFILSIVVLISNLFLSVTENGLIIAFAVVATIANGSLILLILLFSVSKKVGPSIVIKILKLLNKLKIIKNYKVTFFKVSKFIKNYQKSMKSFTKSVGTLIFQFILSILVCLSIYALVFFIYLAFKPASNLNLDVSYYSIVCCMVLCELVGGIMPLPGGSGLAEISFDALFRTWFGQGLLPWALLIWRTLTYFIYIIVGGIQIFCSYIKSVFLKRKNIQKEKSG